MLKSLQVATKVKMGWGEMPSAKEPVMVKLKTSVETMTLGELLYWALMGEGRVEAGV